MNSVGRSDIYDELNVLQLSGPAKMNAGNEHLLISAVRDSCRSLNPLSERVVVAISGGPDSVALALALKEIGSEVTLAHVNHQLRGPESDADADFVRDFANRDNLKVEVCTLDTSKVAKGDNLEASARRQRYDQLLEIAMRTDAPFIATGHTADDQAETVLFRIMRGSGLRGLAGIPQLRHWRGVSIVRPMLHVRRHVVLDYLQSRQQDYRTDSSNRNLRFTRNRIRHELLPCLETEFANNIVDRLTELADQAGQWDRVLNLQVARQLRRCELARSAGLVILDLTKLQNLSEFSLCEIGRHIWRREHWPQGEMSAVHWRRLASVMRGEVTAVDFPEGISARRMPRVVHIGPGA